MSSFWNLIKSFAHACSNYAKNNTSNFPSFERKDSSLLLFGVLLSEFEVLRRFRKLLKFKPECIKIGLNSIKEMEEMELNAIHNQISKYNEFLDCCFKYELNKEDYCLTCQDINYMKNFGYINQRL